MKNRRGITQLLWAVLAVGFMLTACRQAMTPREYVAYTTNPAHGLAKDSVLGNYKFSLQYCTPEMMLLKSATEEFVMSKKEYKQQMSELKGVHYFRLRITPLNQQIFPSLEENFKDKNIFEREIDYFSFGMQQDVKLAIGKDTLSCVQFTHERVFKHAPYYTFLIAFDFQKLKHKQDIEFIYRDRLLETGTISFRFLYKDISQNPKLNINKQQYK